MDRRLAAVAFVVALAPACSSARRSPVADGGDAAATPSVIPVPPEVARGVALRKVLDHLDEPVGFAVAPGDPERRLFVVEKPGRVRVVRRGEGGLTVDATPLVDVSARVSRGGERAVPSSVAGAVAIAFRHGVGAGRGGDPRVGPSAAPGALVARACGARCATRSR